MSAETRTPRYLRSFDCFPSPNGGGGFFIADYSTSRKVPKSIEVQPGCFETVEFVEEVEVREKKSYSNDDEGRAIHDALLREIGLF